MEKPFTTSLVIAEWTGNEHASIIKMIRENTLDLEETGTLRFQIAKSGGRPTAYAELDEPTATLLVTYLRNTAAVKELKKRLVIIFYQARQLPELGGLMAGQRPSSRASHQG